MTCETSGLLEPSGWLLLSGPQGAAQFTGIPQWDLPNCWWSVAPLCPRCSQAGYQPEGCRDTTGGHPQGWWAGGTGHPSPPDSSALHKEGAVRHAKNASVIWNPTQMNPLAIILPSPKAVALLKITQTSSPLLFPQARPNNPVIGIFSSLLDKRDREDPSYGEERVRKQYYCACWQQNRHSTHLISQTIQRHWQGGFLSTWGMQHPPRGGSVWDTAQTKNTAWCKQPGCSSPDATAMSITGSSCDAGSSLTKQPNSRLPACANFRLVYLHRNSETWELCWARPKSRFDL